uniref:Uncharacterized protein n=1 Tax=Glossina pallidipes TaxID=7398 RepID=A0A1A9Z814_GLOPL
MKNGKFKNTLSVLHNIRTAITKEDQHNRVCMHMRDFKLYHYENHHHHHHHRYHHHHHRYHRHCSYYSYTGPDFLYAPFDER